MPRFNAEAVRMWTSKVQSEMPSSRRFVSSRFFAHNLALPVEHIRLFSNTKPKKGLYLGQHNASLGPSADLHCFWRLAVGICLQVWHQATTSTAWYCFAGTTAERFTSSWPVLVIIPVGIVMVKWWNVLKWIGMYWSVRLARPVEQESMESDVATLILLYVVYFDHAECLLQLFPLI